MAVGGGGGEGYVTAPIAKLQLCVFQIDCVDYFSFFRESFPWIARRETLQCEPASGLNSREKGYEQGRSAYDIPKVLFFLQL